MSKQPLTIEELDSQFALELPERETPVTVIIGCLGVCVGQIRISNVDVDVAAQICAAVEALNLGSNLALTCTIRQR